MPTANGMQRQRDDALHALRKSLEVVLDELDQLDIPADVGALLDQAIQRLREISKS